MRLKQDSLCTSLMTWTEFQQQGTIVLVATVCCVSVFFSRKMFSVDLDFFS